MTSLSCASAMFLGPLPVAHLSPLDLALVVLYLVCITIFGLRFRGGAKDTSLKNYFLAGNTIPWWAIGLSIVSAETSTLTIISIPGVAFAGDFGFLQVVFGYMIGRIVVALIFLPKYFQGELMTAYQLIDQRFGHTLQKVTALLFLLTRAAAEGVRVFAVSIVVGIAIGTRDVLSIAIISALTLVYTFEGGMAAVIWTDVVQMAIYVGGTVVAILTLGRHVPGGWTEIHRVAGAAGKFHLFHFALNLTRAYTFWAGVVGGTFLTMASHGTDQLMVQRMLAAKNLRESRLALLGSGVVILMQFTLFLLIGVGLYVFYGLHPAVFASADRIFPTFIVREMPMGVAGLMVAAILAAAMSNLSAALNSLSSTTVVDFYMRWRPDAEDRERIMVSRASTIVWALVLFAIAVYSVKVGGKGHVVEVGLSIASVAYGALLGVFLLGTLTKYANQWGAAVGMLVGFALNVALWQFPGQILYQGAKGTPGVNPDGSFFDTYIIAPVAIPHIAFTWYVLIGSVVTFVVGSVMSFVFRSRRNVSAAVATLVCLAVAGNLSAQMNPTSQNRDVGHPASQMGSASRAGAPGLAFETWDSSGAQSPKREADFSAISTLVNDAIAAKKLPGAVVVVGHGGKVVFEQAYGVRKLAGEPGLDGKPWPAERMTLDTIFDMASLTKCLATATAVMHLYELHKFAFDDPVAKYLPEFGANGKQDVTIRELLTHYSGLPPDVDLKDAWGLAKPDKAEGYRRAFASPLVATPGTHFEYSDINFIVIGALVEKLSGEDLDVYARQYIFKPLTMSRTRFLPFDQVCGPGASIPKATRPEVLDVISKVEPFAMMACGDTDWDASVWVPQTAPTAHDNEGDGATNPDFDHLLRGVVHDPTTRRMGGVAGQAGVFSDAADMSLFAQALLDKLLMDKGPFPLKQATLKLMTEAEQPKTAETGATIFTPDGKTTKGVAVRGFGWDINSAYSRPRGEVFPIGSFGHTGFTGTSLWMDPASDSYVILLANAIHPGGAASISGLRGQVATAAAKALGTCPPFTICDAEVHSENNSMEPSVAAVTAMVWAEKTNAGPSTPLRSAQDDTFVGVTSSVRVGVDVVESTRFAALRGAAARHGGHLRLGLLTNQTGFDNKGRRTIDVLASDAKAVVPGVELTTLFSPEHGITGVKDSMDVKNAVDAATGVPVASLYGAKDADKRPKVEDLKKLDAVVIDLQDAGVRFYTYESVVGYFVEAAAKAGVELIVLDRPDPVGGELVQGPVSDAGSESYTNYMREPVRLGMTLGELAQFINGEKHLSAKVTVVKMEGWRRAEYFDETGLEWRNPSPNLRSVAAEAVYPGVALVETTNVSVGRGTETPFEHIGAPWIKGEGLAAYLEARKIPGVKFAATRFNVLDDENHYPFHGQKIEGVSIAATDTKALDAPEMGIELIAALHKLYPNEFKMAKAQTLMVNAETMAELEKGIDPRTIAKGWEAELAAFRAKREKYLIY